MIEIYMILYLLYHFAECREILHNKDNLEYCLPENDKYLRQRSLEPEVKEILKQFICAAKTEGEYIKKISECYSQESNLKNIKSSAKEFLQSTSADKALIPMARCLGTMKIKPGNDNDENKKQFHDCMANNDFENKIETTLKKELSDTELTDLEEFMECLAKSTDDDQEETAQDCMDTNPILHRVLDVIRGYVPFQQYSDFQILRSKNQQDDNDDDIPKRNIQIYRITYLGYVLLN